MSKLKMVRVTAKAESAKMVASATSADRLYLEIRKFIRRATLFNAQVAEKVGLAPIDMQVITTLQLNGPSTPTQLAAATRLSSGGVTVALDRLEKAGYVRRHSNPTDRRSLLVTLVPSAVTKLSRLFEGVATETRRVLRTFPENDLQVIVRFFEALSPIGDQSADSGAARKRKRDRQIA